jgi:hypothetical protein
MNERLKTIFRRRDLLRTVTAGAVAAVTSAVALKPAAVETMATAGTRSSSDKRRARYQARSAEVQDFYRVNRYPAK